MCSHHGGHEGQAQREIMQATLFEIASQAGCSKKCQQGPGQKWKLAKDMCREIHGGQECRADRRVSSTRFTHKHTRKTIHGKRK